MCVLFDHYLTTHQIKKERKKENMLIYFHVWIWARWLAIFQELLWCKGKFAAYHVISGP